MYINTNGGSFGNAEEIRKNAQHEGGHGTYKDEDTDKRATERLGNKDKELTPANTIIDPSMKAELQAGLDAYNKDREDGRLRDKGVIKQITEFVLLENQDNKYEQAWMKKNKHIDVLNAKAVGDEAFRETENLFQEGNYGKGWLTESDAFRHAYLSAILAKKLSSADKAKELLWAHEFLDGTSYSVSKDNIKTFTSYEEYNKYTKGDKNIDRDMDIYNNTVGLKIYKENPNASEKELALLVYNSLQNGKLAVVVTGTGSKPNNKRVETLKEITKREKESQRTIDIINSSGGGT